MQISIFSIISILLYATTFINIRYILEYNLFRDVCIFIVAIYLALNIKKICRKCDKVVLGGLLLFVALLVFSFYQNIDIAYAHRNGLIIFSISLIELYLCLSINTSAYKAQNLIEVFCRLQIIFLTINDILIIVAPGLRLKYGEIYLLGDKFTVAYQHLILIGLLLTRESIRKRKIILSTKIKVLVLTGLMIYISFLTNSATALVLMPLFLFFLILRTKGHNFIYSRNGYISLLVLSTLFVFFYGAVLSITPVQMLITQVLGKSATLTARTKIYALIPTLLKGKLLWGYGYGTSYNVMISTYQFPNTQNGIMEWVWQGGIFAAIVLLICIWLLLKNIKSKNLQFESYRFLYAVACVFAVISSIEIVINLQYLTMIVLIYYLSSIYTDEAIE